MKINLRKILIYILTVLSFIFAFSRFRYVLYQQYMWKALFCWFTYFIFLGCIFYIFLRFKQFDKKGFYLLFSIFIIVTYEVVISAATGMLCYYKGIITNVLTWPLLFFVFFEYCRHEKLPKYFNFIVLIGICVSMLMSIPNIQRHLIDYGRGGAVIFPVYFLIGQLALALLINDAIIKKILMICVCGLITISTKRAGFLACVCGIACYYMTDALIKGTLSKRIKTLLVYIVFGLAAGGIGLYLINKYNISIFDRIKNLSGDGGSGRVPIWADVINHYRNSTFLSKLFGHGYHAVYYNVKPNHLQRLAHNSYLEILYDYGIIGLVLLLLFVAFILLYTVKMIKKKYKLAPIMAYTIFPMLILSCFSYFFEQFQIITPFVITWGIVIGSYIREKGE